MIMKTKTPPENLTLNTFAVIFTTFMGILTTAYGGLGLFEHINSYPSSFNIATIIVGILGILCGISLFSIISKK
jgi:hypothetical protein